MVSILFSINFYRSTGQSNEALGIDKDFNSEGKARVTSQYSTAVSKADSNRINESIMRLDDNSSLRNSSFFSFWTDPHNSCNTNFKCAVNFSTGWGDNTSIQISTMKRDFNNWSRIFGKEVSLKPNERYEIITHLKHNKWSTHSHIELQGFNETSKQWYQIEKCPPSTNESLEWNEYKCVITLEPNISKVRAVLNAGWSSKEGQEAVAWFDSLYIIKFKPFVVDPNLKAEVVYQGLVNPVSMQFLGPDDFLVIENNGTVLRITNGKQVGQPLLLLDVAYNQGLLGIAVQKKSIETKLV